jgi:hypothetical protein
VSDTKKNMAYPPNTSSEGEAVPNVENASSLLRGSKDSFLGKTCIDCGKKLVLNFLCACLL